MVFIIKVELPRENSTKSYSICHEVLTQLGEDIPQAYYSNQMYNMLKTTSEMMERIVSDTDLLDMKEMTEKNITYMEFYGVMTASAYFARPEMRPFLICRKVQLTINTNSLCVGSIMCVIEYASMLCEGGKDIEGASRIGKAAMSCFKKRYLSRVWLPRVNCVYYSFVAFYTEPLQSCADMLRLGFDVGMSAGDTVSAIYNAACHIKTALASGERLPILLDKVDYYLGLAETYQHKICIIILSILRDTILTLIGKAGLTSLTHNYDAPPGVPNQILEIIQIHSAMKSYWQGHCERCRFQVEKLLKISSCVGKGKDIENMVIMFIHGLNSFQVLRTRNVNNVKIRYVQKKAIDVFRHATSHSGWNFRNKVGGVQQFIFWIFCFSISFDPQHLNSFLHTLLRFFC
jgi:hypothetical protein